jgi:hypothetical protein
LLGLKDDNTTNCTRSCALEFNLVKNANSSVSLEAAISFGDSILEDFDLSVDLANLAQMAGVSPLSSLFSVIFIENFYWIDYNSLRFLRK